MTKASAISVRIDDTLKTEAESIFQQLGLTTSQAIMLFYRQVTLQNGLPFAVRLPDRSDWLKVAADTTSQSQFSARGKYAHLATSSDQFAQHKEDEIELER